MRSLLKIVLLFLCVQASAQKQGYRYQGSVQGGLLEGKGGSAFQLQTVNGLQYKTWAAGVGVGLDYYHTRSIPLFLSLRKNMGAGSKTPFVYLNGGYHFPWLKEANDGWYISKAKGGLYYDAGIGYQVPVFKASSLFFSLGFSGKEFTRTQTFDGPVIAIYPAPWPDTRLYEFNLRRLSIQTGLRF